MKNLRLLLSLGLILVYPKSSGKCNVLNFIGKFIELGPSILRSWLGSGRLVLKLIVCSILKGVVSKNFSRCQSPDPHICSLLPQIGFERQEACYATDEEKIQPLKKQYMRDNKRPRPKATSTCRQFEISHVTARCSISQNLYTQS